MGTILPEDAGKLYFCASGEQVSSGFSTTLCNFIPTALNEKFPRSRMKRDSPIS